MVGSIENIWLSQKEVQNHTSPCGNLFIKSLCFLICLDASVCSLITFQTSLIYQMLRREAHQFEVHCKLLCFGMLQQGSLTKGGKLSSVDLFVLTSLEQVIFILKIIFTSFCKTSYLNQEVNCTEPSPSVWLPWIQPHLQASNMLKTLVEDKHSSLLAGRVSDELNKKFYSIDTCLKKLLDFSFSLFLIEIVLLGNVLLRLLQLINRKRKWSNQSSRLNQFRLGCLLTNNIFSLYIIQHISEGKTA